MFRKGLRVAGIVTAGILVAIQFARPARTNPPADPRASFQVVMQPPAEVASSLKRACHDCHSNETVWPWYSNIAPLSWLIVSDVNEGRARLNFSTWSQPGIEREKSELGDLCEEVQAGKMPLPAYTLMHPQAKLKSDEISGVCALRNVPQEATVSPGGSHG